MIDVDIFARFQKEELSACSGVVGCYFAFSRHDKGAWFVMQICNADTI